MYLGKILKAFAEELHQFQSQVTKLINESIPGLANELLPEWEEDLGLPDICGALTVTEPERAAVAHAKYYGKYYGMGKDFYIDYADNLGATITISEYIGTTDVFRVSKSRVTRMPAPIGVDGSRLRSSGVIFKWIVNVYNTGDVSLEYLQCIINKLKPAHTQVFFIDYT